VQPLATHRYRYTLNHRGIVALPINDDNGPACPDKQRCRISQLRRVVPGCILTGSSIFLGWELIRHEHSKAASR
jgi:hypothetical protein